MHNNIMAAGSMDRPPMLATGRYAQWRSRFLRYIDTRPNGDALRKCILKGPYTPTIVTTPAVPAIKNSPAFPKQTTVETVMNMTPENRAHFKSEKEAIHLILTGIGDEIYLTVDALTGDSNVIPDSPDMCDNDIQDDQNDVECDDERDALANLIANLKLDVDENKTFQKQLKKANATLTQELTECKSILAETSRTLRESNSTRDRLLAQKEIDIKEGLKVKAYKISVVKEKLDELVKQSLLTKSHYEGLVKENTKVITDLKLKEEKDIDKMISMENQLKFLNEIVYKRSQSIQTIHMLAPKCPTFNGRPTFANPMYLKKAQYEKPCLYMIPHDQSDPAKQTRPQECDCLAQKLSEQTKFEHEQYFDIQDLKAQLQDKNIAISELKKLIDKCKGKSVDTKFDKPSVVRQPNAQRIPKPSVLGKPAPFSNSLERTNFAKKKSVSKTNESYGLSKPVTPQNLPQTATQAVRNKNVIKPGMYQIASSTTQTKAPQLTQTSRNTNPRVSTSTGVAHRTNVSRPQPRSNQMKDKVLPNTSQVKFKKTKVEDHPRISRISNQTKSITTCNDSLNSRTLNVNAVCATCGRHNSLLSFNHRLVKSRERLLLSSYHNFNHNTST
ncbi:hypothetical protein Tco_1294727 [Tanacetum coccineum]